MTSKIKIGLATQPLVLALGLLSFARQGYATPESWYWGGQVGWGLSAFTRDYEVSQDNADQHSNQFYEVSFHLPIQPTALLGISVSGQTDNFDYGRGHEVRASQNMAGGSYVHAMGPEPFVGSFLRADAGAGELELKTRSVDVSKNITIVKKRERGLAFLVGWGYGWLIGTDTRLLVLLSGQHIEAKSGAGNAYSASFGLKF